MGKTLTDFKEGRIELYRDRLKWENLRSEIGDGWFQTRPNPKTALKYSAGSLSRCVDQEHPGFHRFQRARNSGRHGSYLRNLDIGGPLAIEHSSLTMPTIVDAKYLWDAPSKTYQGYQGVYFPSNSYKNAMLSMTALRPPAVSSELGISRGDLRTLGSTAIAKSVPDVPDFSLFRFVGELKAGLPKIPSLALLKEKKVSTIGGEYLNLQFGILPTMKDLEKLIELVNDPSLRSAVKRKLGEEHRVRKTLDKGSTRTTTDMPFNEYNTVQGLSNASGQIDTTESYKIWSSCSFVYLQANRLDQLLTDFDQNLGGWGILPTALDMWNLTAWSWFVDWFVNFNHVITSLSYMGKDGLYMQRGYLMATFTKSEQHRQRGTIYGTPFNTMGLIKTERKYRIAASPFGFGYTWKEFSPFQLSILGALGVNRLRF